MGGERPRIPSLAFLSAPPISSADDHSREGDNDMTGWRILILLLGIAFGILIAGVMVADVPAGPALDFLTGDGWGIVTLVDVYLGFLIAASIIFIVEENKLVAAAWALPIFILGNVVTALWFALRIGRLLTRNR